MNVYIFEDVEHLTSAWHEGGGLVVVAHDREGVDRLIVKNKSIQLTKEDWDQVKSFQLLEEAEPQIFIFPDAGCC